jgi:hypothetical protein
MTDEECRIQLAVTTALLAERTALLAEKTATIKNLEDMLFNAELNNTQLCSIASALTSGVPVGEDREWSVWELKKR